jgi:hypothetical protein
VIQPVLGARDDDRVVGSLRPDAVVIIAVPIIVLRRLRRQRLTVPDLPPFRAGACGSQHCAFAPTASLLHATEHQGDSER